MPLGDGTNSLAETSFDEADVFFRDFLAQQGFDPEFRWIFREDVIITTGQPVFVRTPIPADNRERAREYFELGKRRDFGIAFHAVCILEDHPCAYVILPTDDIDAQYRLMGNLHLKLAHRTPMHEAISVSSLVGWKFRQLAAMWSNTPCWKDEVPSRIVPAE